jgi:hypothetical protein
MTSNRKKIPKYKPKLKYYLALFTKNQKKKNQEIHS